VNPKGQDAERITRGAGNRARHEGNGDGDMDKLTVRLCGSTTVTLPDGTLVTDLGGIKPRQILEMLAISLGSPVPKDRLADQLWNGEPPKSYIGTLESYVSLLRRRLGVGRGRTSAIATTSAGYVLDPALVEVDLDEFRRLVQPTARTSAATALARTEKALALMTGDLLASEPYADWAITERTLFCTEHAAACRRAGEHALDLGRPDQAVDLARRAITGDPIAETSWQLLMRALLATGARNDALRAYAQLRNTTINELGSEPGPASQALYRQILEADRDQAHAPATATEVRTLLRLLRGALDSYPGLELATEDTGLLERATQLVGAA
jgi:DNA-binding SARP family transcriptional activator